MRDAIRPEIARLIYEALHVTACPLTFVEDDPTDLRGVTVDGEIDLIAVADALVKAIPHYLTDDEAMLWMLKHG